MSTNIDNTENTTTDKRYVSLNRLSAFLAHLKDLFVTKVYIDEKIGDINAAVDGKADVSHGHNDIYHTKDEVVALLTVENIDGLQGELDIKSDVGHSHDDVYYTKTEINTNITEINERIGNIVDGTTIVAEATHASNSENAENANSATKAIQDGDGNIITSAYETKDDANSKLSEAKSYADGIKNDLLNGAGEAYDTLKELGDLIDDNTDAIEALEIVATGKADKVHSHDDQYYTEAEIDTKVSDLNTSIRDMSAIISSLVSSTYDPTGDIARAGGIEAWITANYDNAEEMSY